MINIRFNLKIGPAIYLKNIDLLSWNDEYLIYNIVRSFRGMGTTCQDVFWEAIDYLINIKLHNNDWNVDILKTNQCKNELLLTIS